MTLKKQDAVTQEEIHSIKRDVSIIGDKLNQVLDALVGNTLSKDGGIVGRIVELENQITKSNRRLYDIERVYKEKLFYMKTMWFVAGGFIMTVLALIFKR